MPKPIVCLSEQLRQFLEIFRSCFSKRRWRYFHRTAGTHRMRRAENHDWSVASGWRTRQPFGVFSVSEQVALVS
jgi:hypothetical protein